MPPFEIAMAEKRLQDHLRRGGSTTDTAGAQLVRVLIERFSRDPNIRAAMDAQHITVDDLAAMYAAAVADLMPQPCIDGPPVILAPTLLFMEPARLRDLLEQVGHDKALLTEKGIEQSRHIRDQANADPNRDHIIFEITPQKRGGQQSTAGCLTFGVVASAMGLGWTAYAAMQGTWGVLVIVLPIFIGGLLALHIGLHALAWPANLIAGLAILLVGLYGISSRYRFTTTAMKTEGEVKAYATFTGSDAAPIVRFATADGRSVELTSWVPWRKHYSAGDRVPVIYDPKNAEDAVIDSFGTLWLNWSCVAFFGAALVLSVLYVHGKEEDQQMLGRPS